MRTIIVLAALSVLPAILRAQILQPVTPDTNKVQVDAFVSTSYSYNFNHPASGRNNFRVFDFDDRAFKLDVLQLVVQRTALNPGDAGFRADLAVGATIPRLSASRGFLQNPEGTTQYFDIQQAFFSYIAPVGSGLRFDLGKFVTPVGLELIEGYDGYNDNATHTFLYGYAIPYAHAGLRLGYTFSPRLKASLMLANGWDVVDLSRGIRTVCGDLVLTPSGSPALTLSLGYMIGAEREGSSDLRHLVDVVATCKLTDRLSVGLNADYGAEAGVVSTGDVAVWQGIAGYTKLALSDRFSLAFRGEVFDDRDGARTGIRQTLKELTLTPEYHPITNLVFRADFRIDFSNMSIFDTDAAPGGTQPTVLLNGIYVF